MNSLTSKGFLAPKAVVAILAVAVFIPFLGRRDIVTSHEARVAQTARQMSEAGWPWDAQPLRVPVVNLIDTPSGKRLAPVPREGFMEVNPWLVPIINRQVRLQKPPLPYWCAAVAYRMCGLNEQSARLVPALLGALSALLIFDLARQIFGHRHALPAAVIWITTYFVIDEFRKSMADPYLAFFTLLAIWAWCANRLVLVYAALALGMLAKGPVIFATTIPAIVACQLLLRSIANRKSQIANHVIGLGIFLIVSLPWYAYIYRHVPHALALWRYESIGELSDNEEKARAWWFYLPSVFRYPLPWTPVWIAGVVLALRPSARRRQRLAPLIWFAATLLIFSVLNVKKDAYLLPVMPAIVLTCSDAVVVTLIWARRTKFRDIPGVLATAQAAIGIGVCTVVLVLLARARSPDRLTGIAAGVVALLVAIYVLRPIATRKPARWFAFQVIAYAALLVVLLGVQRPQADDARSPRGFAAALSTLMRESGVPVLVAKLPEEVAFYLPLDLPDAQDAPRVLAVVDDTRGDIARGKQVIDANFFSTWADGAPILEVREIPVLDTSGARNRRYRLYELLVDRSRA